MLEQIVICVLSALAIFLVAGAGGRWVKWGCLSGLIAQPLWFHTGIAHGVWVISLMSTIYAFSYAKGLWRERYQWAPIGLRRWVWRFGHGRGD